MVININLEHVTPHELNVVDETISYVFNAARKFVEGIDRRIPCTPKKIQKEMKMKYIKGLIRKKKGARIDEKVLEKRKDTIQENLDVLEIKELELKLLEAKNE